jgi:transposase
MSEKEFNELKNINKALETRILELEALVKQYEEQLRLSKHRQFGASSEKTSGWEQLGIFNEPENEADKKLPEPTLEEITYVRKKRVGKREEDLADLPVEVVEHTIPDEEQVCPQCGEPMHFMKYNTRREVIIIPAQAKVIEHKSAVYSCRNCEKTSDSSVPIITSPSPESLIKGSLASASIVAYIMTQKFVNAMPLYRQEKDFLRNGFILSRQTMANWSIYCAENWLRPIYTLLIAFLIKFDIIQADETVLQVLHEPGKSANTNSYMWLYRTSASSEHPIAIYEYQPTRSSSHPKKFLENFSGYLLCDGYSGYHNLPENIIIVGCLGHARRKFDEALKIIPKEQQETSATKIGFDFCNQLFIFEREFKDLDPQARYEKRIEKSLPIAKSLFEWAESIGGVLPKSALGKAINYLIAQKKYLMNVFLDGRLEISNNLAERTIKPFVIGRKNWLFCNTQKGANASSVIYSILETAIENGLKPYEYMKFLLETIPNTNTSKLVDLLPWSESIPDYCKNPKHK